MSKDEAWQRLAELLLARRIELGYPKRVQFVRALQLKHDRTIAAIENAERSNYTSATLAQLEAWYRWEPGSIREVLAGGEPRPKGEVRYVDRITAAYVDDPDRSSGSAHGQVTSSGSASGHAPDPDPFDIEDDAEAMQEFLRQRAERKGKSLGRADRQQQDRDAERPDPEGPEFGA